jgi:uncharacterized protein YcnI
MKRYPALGAALLTALAATSSAWGHAEVSPAVVKAKASQLFTLNVPTEKENATTTTIELTPPPGFSIDSFVAVPGWQRKVQQTGSGEQATITKVTWSGGSIPTGEATNFPFLASTDSAKSYSFDVRQTYSDGSVVDWSGPESSDTPAPVIEAKPSLGGGGGTSIVTWIALVLGAVGALLGLIALMGRPGGEREIA